MKRFIHMTSKKTRILVLFGGRSPEHDVSVITGIQVAGALDPALYEAIPLYIAPNGQWLVGKSLLDRNTYIPGPEQMKALTPVALNVVPSSQPCLKTIPNSFWQRSEVIEFDVALLSFHGLIGEDGGIQGMMEVANVPYTGMRSLASSIFMDKLATKNILGKTNIPILPCHVIKRPEQGLMIMPQELEKALGNISFPCCIKPAHLGSSIGVARVKDFQELSSVLPGIFKYDDTAILEPFVENLVEYNVAVCRVNGEVRTSAIERPKCSAELLDFKTKYMSGGGKLGGSKAGGTKVPGQGSEGMLSLTRDINPDIPTDMENKIRAWAVEAFEQVNGSGNPRLDFLCNGKTNEIWFNEANPCPGSFGYFLWETAPKPILFTELLDNLIKEARELHARAQIPADPTPEGARLFRRK